MFHWAGCLVQGSWRLDASNQLPCVKHITSVPSSPGSKSSYSFVPYD
uniref:Uncharacterized protein n=1 Tax=Rhizophora mucronata TaxID=61149 RepID=A0A2P2MKT1_RHIMU